MFAKITFVILLSAVTVTVGREYLGECRNLTFRNGQDNNKVAGIWYPSYVTASINLTHCNSTAIVALPNGGLTLTEEMRLPVDFEPVDQEVGKFSMTYPNQTIPFAYLNFIDSDATKYIVVVVCMDFGDINEEQVWVFSRQPALPDNLFKNVKNSLAKLDIHEELFKNPFCFKNKTNV